MKAGPSEQMCSGLYLCMRQIGAFLPQEISPRVPAMLLESLVLTAPWGGTEDPVCTPEGLLWRLHNEAAEAKQPLGQITVSESSRVAVLSKDGDKGKLRRRRDICDGLRLSPFLSSGPLPWSELSSPFLSISLWL